MRTLWKVFLTLALVLPLAAFVAGSLVASAADDPTPRQTIRIGEPTLTPARTAAPQQTRTPRPSATPTSTPTPTPPTPSPTSDDSAIPQATSSPSYFDDHGGDDHSGGDDSGDDRSGSDHSGSDHSGRGRGGDDSSGHGGDD